MSVIFLWVILFAGVSAMGSFARASRPSKNKVRNDIDSIRSDLKVEAQSLAPWNKEEIELFSLNRTQNKRRRGWSPNFSGHFTNIYHEKVLLYHLKRYGARGRNALLIVRNSINEYIYNVSKDGIEIYMDEYYLGFLKQNGDLVNTKTGNVLAHLDRSGETSREMVRIGDRIIGAILKSPEEDNRLKQRAFEIGRINSEKEEQIFLALGYFNLIIREIK